MREAYGSVDGRVRKLRWEFSWPLCVSTGPAAAPGGIFAVRRALELPLRSWIMAAAHALTSQADAVSGALQTCQLQRRQGLQDCRLGSARVLALAATPGAWGRGTLCHWPGSNARRSPATALAQCTRESGSACFVATAPLLQRRSALGISAAAAAGRQAGIGRLLVGLWKSTSAPASGSGRSQLTAPTNFTASSTARRRMPGRLPRATESTRCTEQVRPGTTLEPTPCRAQRRCR